MIGGHPCRCECGGLARPGRKYVNKAHQIAHMRAGEASRLNGLQPVESKRAGGHVAGKQAAASGRLAEAAKKGGARSHEIAVNLRPGSES